MVNESRSSPTIPVAQPSSAASLGGVPPLEATPGVTPGHPQAGPVCHLSAPAQAGGTGRRLRYDVCGKKLTFFCEIRAGWRGEWRRWQTMCCIKRVGFYRGRRDWMCRVSRVARRGNKPARRKRWCNADFSEENVDKERVLC